MAEEYDDTNPNSPGHDNTSDNNDVRSEALYQSSGSYFSSLTASNASSDERRPRSKKRKKQDANFVGAQTRKKCLKAPYNDDYRKLLNQAVSDVFQNASSTEPEERHDSQIGVVAWSIQEKESLFGSIQRLGCHDLAAISRAVGTKSELEILQFISLLESGSAHQQLRDKQKALLDASTLSAAFEISDDCGAALEAAADALALYQKREDERREKQRHGSHWLLTPKVAKRIDLCLRKDPNGEAKIAETVPSAVLLDLKVFLDLSSRLFMNSGDQDHNWRTFVDSRERPSIFFTAFYDLTNLVLAVTERLVQTVIFLAMSRLRAMEASSYIASHSVTKQDVKAALAIVGMKADAKDYWVGVAERCKLNIIDSRGRVRKRKIFGRQLDYDEVVEALSKDRNQRGSRSQSTSKGRSSDYPNVSESSSTVTSHSGSITADLQPESASEGDMSSSPALSDSKLTFTSRENVCAQNRLDHAQLVYMSALDHRNGLEEEQRLWALLDKAPTNVIHPEPIVVPRNPGPERRTRKDLQHWRTKIGYGAEWEMNDAPVPAGHFDRNRVTCRKRKRGLAQWEDIELVDEEEDAILSSSDDEVKD
ncbi:MAG: hypothetical protein Q9195_007145 [Heterodermia aff. obscurata]